MCGSEQAKTIAEVGRGGEPVNTSVCLRCGFLYSRPRISSAQHEECYSGGGFSLEHRKSQNISNSHLLRTYKLAVRRYKYLKKWIPKESDKPFKVLDVGSGVGSFLRCCKASGLEVEGIEPDPAYAELSSEMFQVKVQSTNVEDADLSPESFDAVCSFHVIEHVADPKSYLQSMGNALKKDGFLYLECPGLDNMHTRHIKDFFWAPHVYVFTKRTLEAMVKASGFSVLEVTDVPNGFIQVLAQKSGKAIEPAIPVESAQKMESFVQAEMKKKEQNSASLLDEMRNKLKNDPADFIPAMIRRTTQMLNPGVNNSIFKKGKKGQDVVRILHLGLHKSDNAGDKVLFDTIRPTLDVFGQACHFELRDLWREFREEDARKVQELRQVLLVGGGGLILPDTNRNPNSGWQFNIRKEVLERLTAPVAYFAIGYNAFRGQTDFEPVFEEHINLAVEKSLFFGLRNHGSIEKLKKHLPEPLHQKLCFQPCMTTILWHLIDTAKMPDPDSKTVFINLAFDRESNRFEGDYFGALRRIAKFASNARSLGWKVVCVSHTPEDEMAIPYFDYENFDYEHLPLQYAPTDEVLKAYRKASVVIGMRGHAQMIPFGLQIPIISLISHNKMQYFLNDIGCPEWGVEITDQDSDSKLTGLLESMDQDDLGKRRACIIEKQKEFVEITRGNVSRIFENLQGWQW